MFDVIIPAYNCAGYLERLLKFLCEEEEIDPKRIIVIDDGSTDDETRYVGKFYGCKVIEKEHEGVCAACLAGMKTSEAEFVFYMDSDVIPEKAGMLKKLYQNIRLDKRVAAVQALVLQEETKDDVFTMRRRGGSVEKIDGRRIFGCGFRFNRDLTPTPDMFDFYVLNFSWHPYWSWKDIGSMGWCYILRREAYEQVGGYDERFKTGRYCFHIDLAFRMRREGWRIKLSNLAIVYHPVFKERPEGDLAVEPENMELFQWKWAGTDYVKRGSVPRPQFRILREIRAEV